jgi:hypothetical protein
LKGGPHYHVGWNRQRGPAADGWAPAAVSGFVFPKPANRSKFII